MGIKNNKKDKSQQLRSDFIRQLVQNRKIYPNPSPILKNNIPMKIVQFWDNLDRLPEDVKECIESWKKVEEQGFERLLFDNEKAIAFIQQKLGLRYRLAYDKCYHPAMKSDFFRLCYIFVEGGCYIDIDDVYSGSKIQHLFCDGRLKIQPLCYDIATNNMVSPALFIKPGINSKSWIFYFNNNPLIAACRHPIIKCALDNATLSLEKISVNNLPEIQSTTGPGNLTNSIFGILEENINIEQTILIIDNWDDYAKNKWELSYRNDNRNWRLSNRIKYREF